MTQASKSEAENERALTPEQVAAAYEAAFVAANGRSSRIRYVRGWYRM